MAHRTKRRADALPVSVAPQLATLVTAPPTRGEWVYEIKLDGYRILARCDHGSVRLFTRNGNDWTDKMPSLVRELAAIPVETAWLDGEVVVLQANGLPDFNALQNAFDKRQGSDAMTYFVFDALYLEGHDLRRRALRDRRQILQAILARHEQNRVRLSETFHVDGTSILQSACKMGLEGIIAKRLDAAYKGVRDETWLKIKCQRRQEFVVGGFAHRAGSGKEVGTLMLGVYDEENRLRYAGSVGTGWKSAQAVALLAELTGLETDEMPFHSEYPPTKGRWSKREAGGERWAQPRMVVEVSFVEWTPDGHIRHPTFLGVRRDKKADQIRRE